MQSLVVLRRATLGPNREPSQRLESRISRSSEKGAADLVALHIIASNVINKIFCCVKKMQQKAIMIIVIIVL